VININQKSTRARVTNINPGSRFNLLQIVSENNQSLEISDWKLLPLEKDKEYFLTYTENKGFFNLVSVKDIQGNEIQINREIQIEKTITSIKNLQFELQNLREVI
jgi:hypothetical protein